MWLWRSSCPGLIQICVALRLSWASSDGCGMGWGDAGASSRNLVLRSMRHTGVRVQGGASLFA